MIERDRLDHRLEAVTRGLLLAFLIVGAALVYWAVARAPALAARGDNPRVVQAELRIRRGRILDSNGVILAETVGPAEEPERVYPVANIGPAVGYYSFRHGTAGVEEGYAATLRGDDDETWQAFWQRYLHEEQRGRDIRLTLNSDWQRAADARLGEARGAIILITLPDAAIRAMVSHPGYDPNRLDEQFEALLADENAPLLNRATQGLYQPGMVMQPFILSAAVDRGLIALSDEVEGAGEPVVLRGDIKRCHKDPPDGATWRDVLQGVCPAPMQTLAQAADANTLAASLEDFGFMTAPELPVTTAAPPANAFTDEQAMALGQGALTLTPLQLVLAFSALGNGGALPEPQLVEAVQDAEGVWQNISQEAENPEQAVSASVATAVLDALPRHENLVAEHSALVLSGPAGSRNAWYLGLAPSGTPRYAVVVVIEDADDISAAQQVGREILSSVLAQG